MNLVTEFTVRVPTARPCPPGNCQADGVTPKLSDSSIYLCPRGGGRRDVGDLLFHSRLINEKNRMPEGGVDGGSSITFRTDQGSGTRGEWPEPMRSDVLNALKKLVPLCWPVRSVRPLDRETELWTDGMAYASGGGPLYPDTACTAWDA